MVNTKIVLATSNPGKIREFTAALSAYGIAFAPLSEFSTVDVPETGHTFVENAIIKARHATTVSGLPALADDSGLVVEALHGAPGVLSARYAGEKASNEANIQKLLTALDHTHNSNRTAFFHCALVFMTHAEDPMPIIAEASWLGYILPEPTGTGFGYDPIFYVPTEKCSAAELSLETKNRLSHRGRALQSLITQLEEKLCLHSQ